MPAAALATVPSALDAAEAASLVLAGMTAYQMLTRAAGVEPRKRVLVHGGPGGVARVW